MWRPVTRNLLVLSCGFCLFAASGCSAFRPGFQTSLATKPPRPLPEVKEPAAAADSVIAAGPETATDAPLAPAARLVADTLPAAQASRSADIPLPLDAASGDRAAPAPAETDPPAKPDENSCYIEIRALGEKPKRIRMSLDDATHVQKVLEQTGLVKQFRNMEIRLSRKLSDGTRHKMEVRYDTKRNRVISAFDYALHPKDLLVVQQVSATSLDAMLKAISGPLSR